MKVLDCHECLNRCNPDLVRRKYVFSAKNDFKKSLKNDLRSLVRYIYIYIYMHYSNLKIILGFFCREKTLQINIRGSEYSSIT